MMKRLAISLLPFTLVGCLEGNKNTDQLCQSNPGLQCEELNMNDGQCRVARTDLIWHRFEVQKQPSEANKIKEFKLVTAYKKCLELAAQIETIDQSKLQERRFTSLMHSIEESERIVDELSQSNTPETLYFLWSQTGDTNARRSFLQLEGKEALNTAEMQYALATFYTTRDHAKTLKLLNNALTLSNGSVVNTEIFKSMASINHSLVIWKKRMSGQWLPKTLMCPLLLKLSSLCCIVSTNLNTSNSMMMLKRLSKPLKTAFTPRL